MTAQWTEKAVADEVGRIVHGDLSYERKVHAIRELLSRVVVDSLITYRLPDYLGGAPCKLLPTGQTDRAVVEVQIGSAPGTTIRIELDRAALVEVRAPSIDDPAEIPLKLGAGGNNLGLILDRDPNSGRSHALLSVAENGYVKRFALYEPSWLRQLARACWLLAKKLEEE